MVLFLYTVLTLIAILGFILLVLFGHRRVSGDTWSWHLALNKFVVNRILIPRHNKKTKRLASHIYIGNTVYRGYDTHNTYRIISPVNTYPSEQLIDIIFSFNHARVQDVYVRHAKNGVTFGPPCSIHELREVWKYTPDQWSID